MEHDGGVEAQAIHGRVELETTRSMSRWPARFSARVMVVLFLAACSNGGSDEQPEGRPDGPSTSAPVGSSGPAASEGPEMPPGQTPTVPQTSSSGQQSGAGGAGGTSALEGGGAGGEGGGAAAAGPPTSPEPEPSGTSGSATGVASCVFDTGCLEFIDHRPVCLDSDRSNCTSLFGGEFSTSPCPELDYSSETTDITSCGPTITYTL